MNLPFSFILGSVFKEENRSLDSVNSVIICWWTPFERRQFSQYILNDYTKVYWYQNSWIVICFIIDFKVPI